VAVRDRVNLRSDIWIFDLARGARTRLTSGAKQAQNPTWSPDGNKILFRDTRGGRADLYQKATNQPGDEETLWTDNLSKYPTSWSKDGRFILFYTGVGNVATGSDVCVLPLFSDRKPFPFLKTISKERNAKFSPDGRWVAYASN
jgi:Tol biopolymer transport system component